MQRDPSQAVETVHIMARGIHMETGLRPESCRLFARAALAALAEAGMVVVPREPTEVMVDAGWNESAKRDDVFTSCTPRDIYRAMLSAHSGEA